MSKKWSDSDIKYLKRFAASKRMDDLAKRFDVKPQEVRTKLGELGLSPKDATTAADESDPLVAEFEKGLRALHAGKWAQAEKLLGKVAAESDLIDLAERARQYLAVCRRQTTEPSSEEVDPFSVAVYHKNRGDHQAALELCDGKAHAKDERFVYLAAAIHAAEGREAEATKALARAIELNPKNRVHAYHDEDFAELRQQPEHAHLFGLD